MKLNQYQTIIIKIGSSLIIDKNKAMRMKWLRFLARDIFKLQKMGHRVLLVSSGAIASSCKKLKIDPANLSLSDKQAFAAYGQAILTEKMTSIFAKEKLNIAQILVTADDCNILRRKENIRACLDNLHRMNILPIINENDVVAIDEIKFGDNDGLAAEIAILVKADLLVLMSDVDGLYDSDPKINKNAKILSLPKINAEILSKVKKTKSFYGTGGMYSKLQSAYKANMNEIDVVITKGEGRRPLLSLEHKKIYSLFKGVDVSYNLLD
jgi:glutamate 5-kinase